MQSLENLHFPTLEKGYIVSKNSDLCGILVVLIEIKHRNTSDRFERLSDWIASTWGSELIWHLGK